VYFDPVNNRIGVAPTDPRRSDPAWEEYTSFTVIFKQR